MAIPCRLLSVLLLSLFLFPHTRAGAQTWTADNGNGTYSNPLFFDEFSDPDMIRVGADFYLTGTTMHSMPGLPILHSKDLVNWDFVAYAMDKLNLGPAYRLENGDNVYGRGIWAPSFRFHDGTFYIFTNVNGQTTQMFRATDLKGPWTRTPMKRSFHDLSVFFDDDGKVYVVWGYLDIHLAQLNGQLTDILPGTDQIVIHKEQGMGEGSHLYKIHGKYVLTSAWWDGPMRMPTARADKLTGRWEVNQDVSDGEDFGLEQGYRLAPEPRDRTTPPPYSISSPNPSVRGRNAIHQGGIIETPTGEWWGYSMMDANSVGRLLALSPITWRDGWPYFGLPGNLGRTPRTWVKPNVGVQVPVHAPYIRSDDFSSQALQPVWQWSHVPFDAAWSLKERPGFLRLHALPAKDLWNARNTLTQRAIGPRSTATVSLDTSGLKTGDVAGFALFIRPYSWLGAEKNETGSFLVQHDDQTGVSARIPLPSTKLWLRAECDFMSETANFSYSANGKDFRSIGSSFTMVYSGLTFQGVRYALFSYNVTSAVGGFADFDSISVVEPAPHGISSPIPYGQYINLRLHGQDSHLFLRTGGHSLFVGAASEKFLVIDRGRGRVALKSKAGFVSVDENGSITLSSGHPGVSETFQWIETFTGDLTLLSLKTDRYLHVNRDLKKVSADSIGPTPDAFDGNRFDRP
jgi:beta-xylosidase